MQSRDWVTAGAVAGVLGGVVLAVGLARSDGKHATQMRKRLRREAKRLKKETRRLARDTEDWVERARRHAHLPRGLTERFDGADLRRTATEVRDAASEAIAAKAAAVKHAARDAARGTRGALASAGSSGHLDTALETAYERAAPVLGNVPWLMTGTLYGALLHLLSAEGGRPLVGLLRGDAGRYGDGTQAAQRLGVHLAYGFVTALAFELLAEWRKRR
jgi:hypothetical protein